MPSADRMDAKGRATFMSHSESRSEHDGSGTTTAVDRWVSIIIPCRDGAKHVGALIDRLRLLRVPTGWNVELIVGYQRSRDDTLRVLKERGVTIAYCEEFGPGPARNAAVAASRGALLVFIDSDARPTDDDWLVRVVTAAGALGSFGGLGGPILLDPAQARNPVAIADHFACWFAWIPKRRSGKTLLFQPNTFFVMPRDVFDRVGAFDARFTVLQDFELQERIKRAGLPLYFDNTLGVYHVARGTLVSSLMHSWLWGCPYREAYITRKESSMWLFVHNPRLFMLNFPGIFLLRVAIVVGQAMRVSVWKTVYCLPFLLLTIFAWAVGVVLGKGQPVAERTVRP